MLATHGLASALVGVVLGAAISGACSRRTVEIEPPSSGRALSSAEDTALRQVSESTFHDVHAVLQGLPERLTIIVRWGKDVIPETGEGGASAYPGNIGLTFDPDRDVLAVIRNYVRFTLIHELHHLARASRITDVSIPDRVVTEGLATAFERDFGKTQPLWAQPPPEEWIHEILSQPRTADSHAWMFHHPDGRRWIGMRVGTLIVDRSSRASGRSAAEQVFAPSIEILRLADAEK